MFVNKKKHFVVQVYAPHTLKLTVTLKCTRLIRMHTFNTTETTMLKCMWCSVGGRVRDQQFRERGVSVLHVSVFHLRVNAELDIVIGFICFRFHVLLAIRLRKRMCLG